MAGENNNVINDSSQNCILYAEKNHIKTIDIYRCIHIYSNIQIHCR